MLPPNIKIRLALFLLLAALLVASAGLQRHHAAAGIEPAPVAKQKRENLARQLVLINLDTQRGRF